MGADGRFMILRWGPSEDHQYFGVIGPRFAYSRGRWTGFGSAEGGLGHARYSAPSFSHTIGKTAPTWWICGGVDYELRPRMTVRVGEFDYGGISVLQNGLNPKVISAGIVIRPF